jgi:hypothetical protein
MGKVIPFTPRASRPRRAGPPDVGAAPRLATRAAAAPPPAPAAPARRSDDAAAVAALAALYTPPQLALLLELARVGGHGSLSRLFSRLITAEARRLGVPLNRH